MKQLGGGDHLWFTLDTDNTPMHLLLANIYSPQNGDRHRVTLNGVKRYIGDRIGSLPLREKLVSVPFKLDYPYWVEDADFHLDNHIFQTRLNKPGNRDALLDTLRDIMNEPLDFSRPLWEMHLISGLGRIADLPRGSFALALKVHHGQFDGTNLTKLLAKLHSPVSLSDAATSTAYPTDTVPSRAGLLARAAWNNYAWAWRSSWVIGKNMPNILSSVLAQRGTEEPDSEKHKSPRTRFCQSIKTRHRVFDCVEFPLDDIQRIRRKVQGATVNDAALAVMGGALRRYLSAHGELPDEPLILGCPVSAHHEDDDSETGNRVSFMQVTVHTNVSDPLDGLRLVRQSTQEAKRQSEKMGAGNVADMVEILPTNLLGIGVQLFTKSRLVDRIPMGFSGVALSNVPGSREPVYFDGARLVKSLGIGFLTDGMGLLVAVTSFGDQFSIQFVSSPDVMPDPEFFKACIEQAVNALDQA